MTLGELKPFGDRILVRPDPKAETSDGGLHIPQVVLADNPNYYTMSGVVVKLGDGYREDVYECCNQQCGYQSRRTVGEYCPVCKATQRLAYYDDGPRHAFDVAVGDRVLFGRFAGKQMDVGHGSAHAGIYAHVTEKLLLMREVEVLGILDLSATVTPGYQAANWNKPSKGLTPEVTTVPR